MELLLADGSTTDVARSDIGALLKDAVRSEIATVLQKQKLRLRWIDTGEGDGQHADCSASRECQTPTA